MSSTNPAPVIGSNIHLGWAYGLGTVTIKVSSYEAAGNREDVSDAYYVTGTVVSATGGSDEEFPVGEEVEVLWISDAHNY